LRIKIKPLILTALMISYILLQLCGCSGSNSVSHGGGNTSKTVTDVLNSEMAANDSQDTETETESETEEESITQEESIAFATEGVDLDLSVLSGNMVYTQVYNLLVYPDDYIGKTIRMSGEMSVLELEETGKTYYSCLIYDATACCAKGIEFVLADGNYPESGTPIIVQGTFDTYLENGNTYIQLIDAKLITE